MNQSVVEVLLDLPFFLTSPGLPLSYFPRHSSNKASQLYQRKVARKLTIHTLAVVDEVCNAYSEMYTIPSI